MYNHHGHFIINNSFSFFSLSKHEGQQCLIFSIMNKIFQVLFLLFIVAFVSNHDISGQRKSKSMRQIERRSRRNEGSLNNGKSRKVIAAEKKLDDTKEQEKAEADKATKAGSERHMNNQSEKTKNMMKETKKNSDNDKKRNREPFFKRLFRKNPHKNKN